MTPVVPTRPSRMSAYHVTANMNLSSGGNLARLSYLSHSIRQQAATNASVTQGSARTTQQHSAVLAHDFAQVSVCERQYPENHTALSTNKTINVNSNLVALLIYNIKQPPANLGVAFHSQIQLDTVSSSSPKALLQLQQHVSDGVPFMKRHSRVLTQRLRFLH